MAQIHRFRDSVAVALGNGETVYLTPKEATKLANKMKACAKDIRHMDFQSSVFTSFSMELCNDGKR